jgi:hypothetical protein
LAHLRGERVWCVWGHFLKGGRWTKPPRSWRTGRKADITNPENWCTFDEALEAVGKFNLAGVGLVLEAAGYSGADFDHCITDSGSFLPIAANAISLGETYGEVSPSGTGMHMVMEGDAGNAIKRDDLGIELYARGRYFTVTGEHIEDLPNRIAPAPKLIEYLKRVDRDTPKPNAKPVKESNSERATAGLNGHARVAGDTFFDRVKALALDRLADWVPVLHPSAKEYPNGAWRISAVELGRPHLEEDLSYHPTGILEFGEETGATAIDQVMRYGTAGDAIDAAHWLCRQMGVEPAALGWVNRQGGKNDDTATEDPAGKVGANLPDMSIVNRNRVAAVPFPVETLRSAANWVVSTAAAKNAPVDYVALGLLVAATGAVGPKRRVMPWEGWTEPGILWGALVGQPGSNKSPAIDPLQGAVRSIERALNANWQDTLAAYETAKESASVVRSMWEQKAREAVKAGNEPPPMPIGAMEPKRPTRQSIWIGNITSEQVARKLAENFGLICFRDELSGLLGSFDKYGGTGGDRSFWLETYGGRPYRYERVSLKEPVDIPFCAVSLLGGIQPDRLKSMFKPDDDDGLAARTIFAWPDAVQRKRPTERVDDSRLHSALSRLWSMPFPTLEDGTQAEIVVPLKTDAANEFQVWWEARGWMERDAPSPIVASAIAKLNGMSLRIAQTLEFLEWAWTGSNAPEPTQVGMTSLAMAMRIIDEWVQPNLLRVYGEAAMPQDQRDAMDVAKWLLKNKPAAINAKDLRRTAGFQGPKKAEEMDAALEVLVDARWLAPAGTRQGGTKGRASKDFNVNSAIYGA